MRTYCVEVIAPLLDSDVVFFHTLNDFLVEAFVASRSRFCVLTAIAAWLRRSCGCKAENMRECREISKGLKRFRFWQDERRTDQDSVGHN